MRPALLRSALSACLLALGPTPRLRRAPRGGPVASAALGPTRLPRAPRGGPVAAALPLAPAATALDDALRLAGADVSDEDAGGVLGRLEALNRKPFTSAFLELGLSGSWELVRYVPGAGAGRAAPDGLGWLIDEEDDGAESEEGFALTAALATFAGGAAGAGTLSSALHWAWAAQGVRGVYTVNSTYALAPSGALQLSRSAAELEVSGDLLPVACQSLLALLSTSKVVPAAVFDPHGSKLELTYMDHEVLLARCAGARHGGARALWRRRFWHAGGAGARAEERQRAAGGGGAARDARHA